METLGHAFLHQKARTGAADLALIEPDTRKKTEAVHQELSNIFSGVGYYHAGLTPTKRTEVQETYMKGDLRILVATNAFGMGIDQADVRLVIHYHMPATIDALYQEMGRAGRDGNDSTCMMLDAAKDKGLQSYFIQSSDAPQDIKSARWRNLDALVNYSESSECRHGEILTYYQDAQRIQSCGHCDNCDPLSNRKINLPKATVLSRLSEKLVKPTKLSGKKLSNADTVLLDETQDVRFRALKAWRKQKASELVVPAFIIFSDRTLRELAIQNPGNFEDLKNVHGIGTEKLERYGADVMLVLTEEHQRIDIARPKENYNKTSGYTQQEIDGITALLGSGWVDTFRHFHPEVVKYSRWNHRFGARAKNVGWRIDYVLVTKGFEKKAKDAFILNEVIGSDHCPVGIEW